MAHNTTAIHAVVAQVCYELFVVKLAIILVNLRYLFLKFCFVTLRQAAHHVQATYSPLVFCLGKLKYGVYAFLLGILNEPASVYYDYVPLWVVTVMCTHIAIGFKKPHQRLAVHKVL